MPSNTGISETFFFDLCVIFSLVNQCSSLMQQSTSFSDRKKQPQLVEAHIRAQLRSRSKKVTQERQAKSRKLVNVAIIHAAPNPFSVFLFFKERKASHQAKRQQTAVFYYGRFQRAPIQETRSAVKHASCVIIPPNLQQSASLIDLQWVSSLLDGCFNYVL